MQRALHSRPARHPPHRQRWRSPIRRCLLPSSPAARTGTRPASPNCPATRPGLPALSATRSKANPVETAARDVVQQGIVDVGEGDRLPASRDSRRSHTLVLISSSDGYRGTGLVMQLGDHVGDQRAPAGLVRGPQPAAGVAVKYSWKRMWSLKCGSVCNFSQPPKTARRPFLSRRKMSITPAQFVGDLFQRQ